MPAGWATDMPDQQGRTALVTGANSGIGFHVALELARHGAHVLLACRDAGRGGAARSAIVRQAPAASVELVALDLADLDSVARLAGQLVGRGDELDLLINNAGVMAVPVGRPPSRGSSCGSAPTTWGTSRSPCGCSRPCWPSRAAGW